MRISLRVGDVIYPLAGNAEVVERVHPSAGGFKIASQIQTQVANRIRAATAPVYDRGNLTTTLTFSTSRIFPTVAEAEVFMEDYDRIYPRTGILVLEAITDEDAIYTRHLLGAVVEPPSRSGVGCTVMLDYTVLGSQIVEVEGEPDPGTIWDTDGGYWES